MYSYVLKSTFYIARSIDLPSKKVLVKCDPQSQEIEKFGKTTQGKQNKNTQTNKQTKNKYENEIEVLWKYHT